MRLSWNSQPSGLRTQKAVRTASSACLRVPLVFTTSRKRCSLVPWNRTSFDFAFTKLSAPDHRQANAKGDNIHHDQQRRYAPPLHNSKWLKTHLISKQKWRSDHIQADEKLKVGHGMSLIFPHRLQRQNIRRCGLVLADATKILVHCQSCRRRILQNNVLKAM